MFFWIPALIPLLCDFIVLVSPLWPISKGQGAEGYERMTNWKKFGIHFGVNTLACLAIAGLMWMGATSATKFPEVWHFRVTDIKHEHEWTVKEQRSREVPDGTERYQSGTDSKGNATYSTRTKYRTEYYDVTEHYGPYWELRVDGRWKRISQTTYNKWSNFWGNERKTGMNDGSSAFGDRSIDGPILECAWPKTFETIYPWSEIHRYVNKIRLSYSILNFGEPTEEMLAKYPRPADQKVSAPIIRYGGPSFSAVEDLMLRRVNADLGARHQVHTMLVTFGKDTPMSIFDDVMSAWGGPNKNELCTFIGLDGDTVKWVKVYSWMDNTTIHATLRDAIAGEPFSVEQYAGLLRAHVPKLWRRKEFTPVNEYLRVPVNPGWMIWGLIGGLVVSVGSFFIIEAATGRDRLGGNRYRRNRFR